MKAAIYCRVSTRAQETEGYSLESQEGLCREYCQQKGYSVSRVFRETHTGSESLERTGLMEMLECGRRREIDVIIAYASDRLSRDSKIFAWVRVECKHADVGIELVTEELDESPTSQLLMDISAFFAEIERQKIKERTSRGALQKVKSGKLLGRGRALYGYSFNSDRTAYEVDPVNGPVVKRVFSESLAGKTMRSIAANLNSEGVPSPGGGRWVASTISDMLRHLHYKGEAYQWRFVAEKVKGSRWPKVRQRPREEWIETKGVIPAIVSPEDWDNVQSIADRNKQLSTRNNHHPEAFLLRGFVRCGTCNRVLQCDSNKGKYYYRCGANRENKGRCPSPPSVLVGKLDEQVWNKILATYKHPMVSIALAMHGEPRQDHPISTQHIQDGLAELNRREKNLLRSLEQAESSGANQALTHQLDGISAQRQSLETELDRLLSLQRVRELQTSRKAQLIQRMTDLSQHVESANFDEKRKILAELDIHVWLNQANEEQRWIMESFEFRGAFNYPYGSGLPKLPIRGEVMVFKNPPVKSMKFDPVTNEVIDVEYEEGEPLSTTIEYDLS